MKRNHKKRNHTKRNHTKRNHTKRNHRKTFTKKLKYNNKSKNIKNIKINYGGAPFVQGGFGCIFSPALKCKDIHNNSHYDHDKKDKFVSKLIETKYANREYEYILKIKKRLEFLSEDIKKYLLINNITICEPAQLSKSDLTNIDEVCDSILSYVEDSKTKLPLTSSNINENLDKFKVINMPKLGESLHSYIKKKTLDVNELIFLNNIILKFISRILPSINKTGVIHGDVKSANILFSEKGNIPVLIDWGLSYFASTDESVPEDLFLLDVQYQHPFSTLLFSKNVIQDYEDYLLSLKKEKKNIDKESLRIFAVAQYSNFKNDYNKIHKYLSSVFVDAFKEYFLKMVKGNNMFIDDTITEDIYINYVINYVVDVLLKYTNTNTNTLNLGKYFKNVYMHNVDIWGVMAIYYELIKKPFDNYKLSSKEYKIYIQMIMNVLVKNIFINGDKVISIGKLIHDIKKINLFLHELNPHEEYKKSNKKITSYEEIVSENIKKTSSKSLEVGSGTRTGTGMGKGMETIQEIPLSNNMKIKDSIGIRKLQLNKSIKMPHSLMHRKSKLSRSNRTQRINVIKI